MIAIVFLLISFIFGYCFITRFLQENLSNDLVKIPISLIFGIFFSVWFTFIFNLFLPISTSIILNLYLLSFISFFMAPFRKSKHILSLHFSTIDGILLLLFILISILLMHQSLHFTQDSSLQIGADTWGDFDIHLPLIRSFAWGDNVPPSLPFFPNANSAYHFMFDYFSGLLEYGGLPLTYAFNIASIIAFSSLLFILYKFTSQLFGKVIVGILTCIFFLFNSTLEFIEAYQKLRLTNPLEIIPIIVSNAHYFSAGPYTSDIVSIIWNMNVYLNQRHLIFAFAFGLITLLYTYSCTKNHFLWKDIILLSLFIGLTPFWSIHVFLCLLIILGTLGVLYFKKYPHFILVIPFSILLALPQIIWLSHDVHNFIQLNPGFLAVKPLTVQSFLTYWIYNLGLSFVTIPLGFILSNKDQKKWFLSFLSIFIIANLIQFNSDPVNNHKLFNFWLLVMNAFTAFVIYTVSLKRYWWKWIIIVISLFFLTFSGIIDMFVVKNEPFYSIADYPVDQFETWVVKDTPFNAIFLLPQDSIYNSVRLAGRKTFAPSPRYADAYGYNVFQRNELIQEIYNADDKNTVLALLHENKITYIQIPKTLQTNISINNSFFMANFPVAFMNNDFYILSVN